MSYKIAVSERFEREATRLLKKYPSLKKEFNELYESLMAQPNLGTSIGKGCYKIRLSVASKGKGKSGGARVITYVYVAGETVYLLSIFDKSEKENISDKELSELLKKIF
jgi:hypothetical protein